VSDHYLLLKWQRNRVRGAGEESWWTTNLTCKAQINCRSMTVMGRSMAQYYNTALPKSQKKPLWESLYSAGYCQMQLRVGWEERAWSQIVDSLQKGLRLNSDTLNQLFSVCLNLLEIRCVS
jgi:hypothetical protein